MPAELAPRAAAMDAGVLGAFDIVEVAAAPSDDRGDVLPACTSGSAAASSCNWLRDRIIELPRANRWQALARAALRDDLFNLHRELTRKVLDAGGGQRRERGRDRRVVRAQRRGARALRWGWSPTSGRHGSTT